MDSPNNMQALAQCLRMQCMDETATTLEELVDDIMSARWFPPFSKEAADTALLILNQVGSSDCLRLGSLKDPLDRELVLCMRSFMSCCVGEGMSDGIRYIQALFYIYCLERGSSSQHRARLFDAIIFEGRNSSKTTARIH